MVFGVHNTTSSAGASGFNHSAAPATTPGNGTARAVRQALMNATLAAAFDKAPSRAGNQTASNSSSALGGAAGGVQTRPKRASAYGSQPLLTTRPRVRESVNASSTSSFIPSHKVGAGGIAKTNGTMSAADFLKTNGSEKSKSPKKTEDVEEKCKGRKAAAALIEVGGLSKETNKTKAREVEKRFTYCFTQPYKQSDVTANPETYEACKQLDLEKFFGFIIKTSKPYFNQSKDFEALSKSTTYTETSAFLKDNFPELWSKAEGLIADGKISKNMASCLAFSAYVNARAENLTLLNGQEALVSVNTSHCDSSVPNNEQLQCIQEAKSKILQHIFGNSNKSVESSSGAQRNTYTGPIYDLDMTAHLFAVFNGNQTDKLFDLAKQGNVTEISADGNFFNSSACTFREEKFNGGWGSPLRVAADQLWTRYSNVLVEALDHLDGEALGIYDKAMLVNAMGLDHHLGAFALKPSLLTVYSYDDDDYDDDYDDDSSESQSLSGPSALVTKEAAFKAPKVRLGNAVDMTKAKAAWAMQDQQGRPLTGQDSHVVIFDTGTDKRSPFLQGATIETLCVSRDDGEHKTHCVDHRTVLRQGPQEPIAYSCITPQSPYANAETEYVCAHGTATTSTIVGRYGLKPYGIAPGASILAVNGLESKVNRYGRLAMNQSPAFYMEVLANLLQETKHKNISSLSMSFYFQKDYTFTNPADFPALQSMFDALRSKGVVAVGSAGNKQDTRKNFPNCMDGVMIVGACRHMPDGGVRLAQYSGHGEMVDIYALSNIRVATRASSAKSGIDDVSERQQGTSYSTPLVAGAAAILRQQAGDRIPHDRLADVTTWALYHRANESDWHRVDGVNLRPVLDVKLACDNMQQLLEGKFDVNNLPGSDEHGEVTSFKDFLPRWQAWRQKNPPSSRDSAHSASGHASDGQASGGYGAGSALAIFGAALSAAGLGGYLALSHRGRRKERQAAERGQELQSLTNQTGKAGTSSSAALPVGEEETLV